MRVELNPDQLHMIQQSLMIVQIQGKDAPLLAELLNILQKSLDKALLSMQKAEAKKVMDPSEKE